MRAHELLIDLLERFALAVPEADFRLGWRQLPAGRLPTRPVVTGQVEKEVRAGGGWEASLGFTVWLPRNARADWAEEIMAAITATAETGQAAPTGMERGAVCVDKNTGLLALAVVFRFGAVGSAAGKKTYPVWLDGKKYAVTGWKVSVGGSVEELVAVGEDEPFACMGRTVYTVELKGLGGLGLALEGSVALQVENWRFEGCRWKSLSAEGGVLVSEKRTEVEGWRSWNGLRN